MFPIPHNPNVKWTTEDMDKLIKRTVRLIKPTMTVNLANVESQARYRSGKIPQNAIGPYLANLSAEKLEELGIPVPTIKSKGDSKRTKPPLRVRSIEKAD